MWFLSQIWISLPLLLVTEVSGWSTQKALLCVLVFSNLPLDWVALLMCCLFLRCPCHLYRDQGATKDLVFMYFIQNNNKKLFKMFFFNEFQVLYSSTYVSSMAVEIDWVLVSRCSWHSASFVMLQHKMLLRFLMRLTSVTSRWCITDQKSC